MTSSAHPRCTRTWPTGPCCSGPAEGYSWQPPQCGYFYTCNISLYCFIPTGYFQPGEYVLDELGEDRPLRDFHLVLHGLRDQDNVVFNQTETSEPIEIREDESQQNAHSLKVFISTLRLSIVVFSAPCFLWYLLSLTTISARRWSVLLTPVLSIT